ncbi:MAG TPA: hypothetical protein VJ824_03310 [Bacillota bacterium]|nr:hypothetical protein [Bacillota bacterium]
MLHNRTALRLTAIFTILELCLLIELIILGNSDFILQGMVVAIGWLVYTFMEFRHNLFLNNYVRLAVMLTLLSDSFLGNYLNGYVTSPFFDRIQHIFGTYSIALWAYTIVWQIAGARYSNRLSWILVFMIGIGLGGIYEIIEFFEDSLLMPAILNQPSLLDTDLDLLSDAIGAFLAAVQVKYADFGLINKQRDFYVKEK